MHEGPTENRLGELGSLYKYYYDYDYYDYYDYDYYYYYIIIIIIIISSHLATFAVLSKVAEKVGDKNDLNCALANVCSLRSS